VRGLADRMFMVMLQDFMDPWAFNQKKRDEMLPGIPAARR
jgi:hypothetical protein